MQHESPSFLILVASIAVLVVLGGAALFALGLALPSTGSGGETPPDESFTFSGIATWVDLEGGFWGFIAEDGTRYLPVNFPADAGLKDGQRIWVKAVPADAATIQMWGTPIEVLQLVAEEPQATS